MKDPIPKDLFDILACPDCKAELKYTKNKTGLLCTKCKAEYPIQDGIPVLMPKMSEFSYQSMTDGVKSKPRSRKILSMLKNHQ